MFGIFHRHGILYESYEGSNLYSFQSSHSIWFLVGWFQFRGFAACPRCNSHPVSQLSFQAPQRLQPRMVGWVEVMKLGYTGIPKWRSEDMGKMIWITKNISSKLSSWSFWYILMIPLIFGYIYIYIGYMWLYWKLWWSNIVQVTWAGLHHFQTTKSMQPSNVFLNDVCLSTVILKANHWQFAQSVELWLQNPGF